MPEQLRPESKDLGEAATTTLNPEPFFLLQNTDELAIILITQGKRKSFSDVFQRQGGW